MPREPGAPATSTEPIDVGLIATAPSSVEAVLDRMGRTEDVRFSPDNRRLAIAAFHEHVIVLVDVELARVLPDRPSPSPAPGSWWPPGSPTRTASTSWTTTRSWSRTATAG